MDVLKHPYLKEFYNPDDIIVSDTKIKVFVNDNQKLSLKDYRNLIYKEIKEKDSQTPSPLNSVLGKKESAEK